MTRERIHWPEALVCAFSLRHHPDIAGYGREGVLRCLDCRIELARSRTWRWRLLEWTAVAILVVALGAPLLAGAWLLR